MDLIWYSVRGTLNGTYAVDISQNVVVDTSAGLSRKLKGKTAAEAHRLLFNLGCADERIGGDNDHTA